MVYTGVRKDVSEEINLKTLFTNRLIIVYMTIQFLQCLLFLSISYYISAIFCIVVMLGCIISFYLSSNKLYLFSKIFIMLYLNFMIFLASCYFSHPLLSYYYLPVIVASTFLFNSKETKYLFTVNFVSIAFLLLENTSLNQFLPSFHKDPHPEKTNLILLLGNLGLILSLIYVYLYYINAKAKKLINLNKKLKKSKVNLKEQSRDYFLFSEASNHFLKSPIYIFNAFIDKIENGINENKTYDELKPYFSVIKHSIEEEEKFINNMFDYNKIILTTAQKKETEIISLLKNILENFKENNLHFQYNIHKNKEKVLIKTDAILFEKIILIITENAYLYNNNFTKKLDVTVEETEKDIIIIFKDNGIGINTEFREKIFKPYVRLNTLENIPGTGIGLLKARKATNLINAKINLINSSNNGSTFQLSINKYTNEENLYRLHRR